ncbi:hypothetical protein [Streptomyces sp. NPDC018947]|uniref:hypothetical protein n=1 Tax=Streptomyces sp. NPDC018947 TaxID=3365054 RepID=UPI0037AF1B3A
MSRETDSPSSGPNGRGGAAYPSGTPPYGTPVAPGAGADAGRSAARPEERKTETTLTTRIRINIPGSRPIPPVVMRKPVADAESDAADAGAAGHPDPDATAAMGGVEAPAEPAGPTELAQSAEEKQTSDWFAPRKSGPPKGGQGGGSTNGAGLSGGSAAPSGPPGVSDGGSPGTVAGSAPSGSGTRPGGGSGRPGGVVGSMNVPGGAGRGGTGNGAGLPGATGGPVAPGHGGGTGSFDVTEALAAGPLGGNGTRPGADDTERTRNDLPLFTDDGPGTAAGQDGPRGPQAPFGGPKSPAGPTTGPVTGDGPSVPPSLAGPGTAARPGGHLGSGPDTARPGPGGGLSDDTAILTPQRPAQQPPGGPLYANPDNVSGNTVTSGSPVAPGDRGTPFPGAPLDGPRPHTPAKAPAPAPAPPAASAGPAKKKGRRKLPLLVGGLIVVAGGAYGAGLLMNHSDVPKGTTVLGVDIGGGTRDDAVEKLDAALGARAGKPLKLTVDGDTVSLKPDQAGLQFDTQATASAAAQSDYNPVSVIGSLFGNHRVVEPVMPVDEEKLHAALKDVAGGAGSVTEGTITFKSGKAVPVYGKPGKAIDVAKSTEAVEQAYRKQVETGATTPVGVPTTTRQPTVSDAEVNRMLKEFAEPAMSGLVTVETDPDHRIAFSPGKSLWKFLGVKPQNGKLVEYYDQAALQELYGDTFDGVLITRGTGQKTPVTVQDVISALRPALMSRSDRAGIIETDPS